MDNAITDSETLRQILETEQKRLRFARAGFAMALIGLALGVITVVTLFFGVQSLRANVNTITATVTDTAGRMNEAIDTLNSVDIDGLVKTVSDFAETGTETMVQLQDGVKSLETITEQADKALKNLNDIDMTALNDGIAKLNEILDPLAAFFGRFRN